MKKASIELIIPTFVLILSAISFYNNISFVNYISVSVSMFGIAASILYFIHRKAFKILTLIWIYAQFPEINHIIHIDQSQFIIVSIFEASQAISFTAGITLGTTIGEINVYVNFLPFFYLLVFYALHINNLSGRSLLIGNFSSNRVLNNDAPYPAKAIDFIRINAELWLHIKLESLLSVFDTDELLIKQKNGLKLKTKKSQKVKIRLIVKEENDSKYTEVKDFAIIKFLNK